MSRGSRMTSFGHSKPCQKTMYIYASLSLIISLIKLMSINYAYNNKKNLTWIFMKDTGCYTPDAYISMCKSTTQETRVQKMPASTLYGARPRRCPHRHLIHAWKDTRVRPLGVHTEMHAPRHMRVHEDTRVGLLLRAPKMAAPTWTRAKM